MMRTYIQRDTYKKRHIRRATGRTYIQRNIYIERHTYGKIYTRTNIYMGHGGRYIWEDIHMERTYR